MARLPLLLPCLLLAACKFGDDNSLTMVDAAVDAMRPPGSAHLLISEVMTTGAGEFVELWNPTNQDVVLTNYYLADHGDYWRLPGSTPAPAATDFLVRFPAGATIASGTAITIATSDSGFAAVHLKDPTYAVNATSGTRAFAERHLNGTPQITNDGEVIVLFHWDGTSDLVKDVDIVYAGTGATGSNALTTKNPVDGPDVDMVATAYKADNLLLGGGMAMTAGANLTYKRRAFEMGNETQQGTGNGIYGDDETSERQQSSWDGVAGAAYTSPTPGTPPSI